MSEYPLVSVVIPTHNRKEKLIRLINSVLKSNYSKEKLEIIVVDDASTDGTYEEVKKRFSKIKIVRNKKEHFSTACRNIGVKKAHGKFIFLVDDDNIIEKNCIKYLVKTLIEDKTIGIVGPLILWKRIPNVIWGVGGKVSSFHTTYRKVIGKKISDISLPKIIDDFDFRGNTFMIRKKLALQTMPNERLFPHNWSEVVWGLNVKKKGYKVATNTKAIVWHDTKYLKRKITALGKFKAYDQARTGIIFVKMYGTLFDKIFYFSLLPFIMCYRIVKILEEKTVENKLMLIKEVIKGTFDGVREK